MRCQPFEATRSGSSTSSENVVRVCERISGSMGRRRLPESSLPVKTARPSAAETPHRNAAEAMKKYPRRGCGCGLRVGCVGDGESSRMASMIRQRRVRGQGDRDRSPQSLLGRRARESPELERCGCGRPRAIRDGRQSRYSISRSSKGRAPGLQKNSHDFAGEAAGLGEEQNSRSHRIFILRVHVFDLTGNFCGLLQHGGD